MHIIFGELTSWQIPILRLFKYLKFKVFYLRIVANSDFKKNEIADKLKKKNIFPIIIYPCAKNKTKDIEIIFNNNIVCSLRSIDITNYGILEMDIFGTAGRLIIDMINHTVDNYVISKKKSLVYKQLTPKKLPAIKKIDEPIVNGLKYLLESMSKSKPSPCDGNQGYKSLELVVASLMSARKNKEMRLPLQSLDYVLSSK